MKMYDIIQKKKNGLELTLEEINFIVENFTNGNVKDYQMSALLMAIVINGMTDEETIHLTKAMANSGDKINLPLLNTVDKHSTGGVGDKTSLIITPIVACLGCNVAKMSGRGLGHTGGTIDKLESIPEFNIQLEEKDFINQVKEIHIALIGQTKNIAPADKKIYALRDVTATVESIPLIASSIMGKKIASGAKNLVLDVKVGNGAFMKNEKDAKKLAEMMVRIGKSCGINTVAILTDMNQPLGNMIGNALEIQEVIEVLSNKGPDDLKILSIELATYMVSITKEIEYDLAKKQVIEVLETGKALNKFYEFIKFQGGNIKEFENIKTKYKYDIMTNNEGYISLMNAEEIGKICCSLGAGRTTKEDIIDSSAGIKLNYKVGDFINKNNSIATFYTSKEIDFNLLEKLFIENIEISNNKPKISSIIIDIIK